MAESIIGLYKAELITMQGPWRSVEDVELATLSWVHRWNTNHILRPIADVPPVEFESMWAEARQSRALRSPESGEKTRGWYWYQGPVNCDARRTGRAIHQVMGSPSDQGRFSVPHRSSSADLAQFGVRIAGRYACVSCVPSPLIQAHSGRYLRSNVRAVGGTGRPRDRGTSGRPRPGGRRQTPPDGERPRIIPGSVTGVEQNVETCVERILAATGV